MHMFSETKVLLFIFIGFAATTLAADPWLSGGKCGPKNLLPDGRPGQCNPNAKHHCCNPKSGWCGNSPNHCTCDGCIDYKKIATTPKPTTTTTTTESTTINAVTIDSSKLPPYEIHNQTYRDGRNIPTPPHNQEVTQHEESTTQSTSTTKTEPGISGSPTPTHEVPSDDHSTTLETTTLAANDTDETSLALNNTSPSALDGPGFRSVNGTKGEPVPEPEPTISDETPYITKNDTHDEESTTDPSTETTYEPQTGETLPPTSGKPNPSHEVTQVTGVPEDRGNAAPNAKGPYNPAPEEGGGSWIGIVIALCVVLLIGVGCLIMVIRNKRKRASQDIMDTEDGTVNGAFQAKEQETALSYTNKGTLTSEESNPEVTVTPSTPMDLSETKDKLASSNSVVDDSSNAASNKQQDKAITTEETKKEQLEGDKDALVEKDNTNDELNSEEKGMSNGAFKEDNVVKTEG